MRGAGGESAEADHEPNLERDGELRHRLREGLPAHVGLGAGEHRDSRAEAVGPDVEHHLRPVELIVDPVDDLELGPAGAVVE